MAKKLSPIVAQVTMDLNKWSAGIKQMQRDQDALTKSLKPLNQALGSFGKPLLATGAAITGGLLAMSKAAANLGDQLRDASQRTGVATEKLSAYKLLAEQSGTSFEAVTGGVGKLSKTLVEAATKGGESARIFNALGISIKDAGGKVRQASDVLPQLADRFAAMEDGTEKAALAFKVFGRSGTDMITFLNEGSAGMKRAEDATRKFGTALTDAETKLGDDFNDALAETKTAMLGLSVSVGNTLLPKLTELVQKGNDWIAVASKMARENPNVTKSFAAAGAALVGAGGFLIGVQQILKLVPTATFLLGDFKGAAQGLSALKGVRSIGDLAAGLQLIGSASVIARTGIYGVIGALGAMRAFVDASIAQKVVDMLPDPAAVGLEIRRRIGIDDSANAKLIPPRLKAPSLPDNWEQISSGVDKAGQDVEAMMAKMMAAMGKADKQTATLTSQTDQLWNSLKREAGELEALEAVLLRAKASHLSLDTVLDKLGPTIADVAQEFVNAGKPMPEIIAEYNALRKNSILLTEQYEEEMEARQRLNQMIFDAQHRTVELIHAAIPDKLPELTDFEKNVKAIGAQKDEVRALAQQMAELANKGFTAAEIEAALGARMENVLERAKELGVGLDGLTRKTLDQASRADILSRSWGEAMAEMSDRVVDLIVDFDFSFKRLGDIAKNTAKDMARSFLDGFFQPFKDGLRNLGEEAGKWASGLIFGSSPGASNQQGGGLLGGILGGGSGGILGGIFGGNGGSGGILGGIFGGGGGTGSPGIAGGIFGQSASGIMGTMNPINAGVSIANQAFDLANKITDKIGKGRDSANEVIKSQEAFVNQTLKGILDDASLSATNKLKLVSNEFDIFNQNLARYSAGGGENPVTANQAFATVAPLVARIKTDLIKQGATDAMGGGSVVNNVTVQPGAVVFQLTDVHTPEEFIHWLELNKAGIAAKVTSTVFAMEHAIVTR